MAIATRAKMRTSAIMASVYEEILMSGALVFHRNNEGNLIVAGNSRGNFMW